MTSYVSDWCPRIDFDSCEPIVRQPRYRSDTALPQEPFELPQPVLSQWFNAYLQFEDEPPQTQTQTQTQTQQVEDDWSRYYIVRAYIEKKLLDITSDEPLPLKLTRDKPETALPQTFQIPEADIRGSIFMEHCNEVFDKKLSYSNY